MDKSEGLTEQVRPVKKVEDYYIVQDDTLEEPNGLLPTHQPLS